MPPRYLRVINTAHLSRYSSINTRCLPEHSHKHNTRRESAGWRLWRKHVFYWLFERVCALLVNSYKPKSSAITVFTGKETLISSVSHDASCLQSNSCIAVSCFSFHKPRCCSQSLYDLCIKTGVCGFFVHACCSIEITYRRLLKVDKTQQKHWC